MLKTSKTDIEKLQILKKLYNENYDAEATIDCDLHGATLSDVTMICNTLYEE